MAGGSRRKAEPPTVADGKVFAASVDQQRICALDADSGKPAWQFTAECARGLATDHLSRPGDLRLPRRSRVQLANVGRRFGLAPSRGSRRPPASWSAANWNPSSPVPGSVLVQDDVAYCTAGRSSYLDGGIDLCRLEPQTGELSSRTPIYSPDPATGRQPPQTGPAADAGAREDILSGDSGHVYLRDMAFDTDGRAAGRGESAPVRDDRLSGRRLGPSLVLDLRHPVFGRGRLQQARQEV